jgi:flagellar hook protein FlgE
VTGTFTNGQQKSIGQVAVASFAAPDRLEAIGGNLFMATPDDVTAGALGEATGTSAGGFTTVSGSGDATVGAAGAGGRGSITSGALEQSNVDITTQFVDMISAQRSFEANSKTITTADQMLSDLIQMKR